MNGPSIAPRAARRLPAGPFPLMRWPLILAIALLLGGGVVLRFARLDSLPGVNGDEAWMGVQAMRLLAGDDVAWRTPTGNPLNPFSFVPLVLSHWAFAPSVAHLRWVAAASGLLLLALNFVLCRMVYGLRMSVVTTVALAVLPNTIAYSRFGWDASQSVLFTLPVLYLPLAACRSPECQGRFMTMAALSWAASVLVHPTNVFAAPLLAVPSLALLIGTLRLRLLSMTLVWKVLAFSVASLSGVIIAIVGWPWWRLALRRAVSIDQFNEFARLLVELFSGVTIYRFLSGALLAERSSELMVMNILSALVLGAVVWGLSRRLMAESDGLDRLLLTAVLVTVGGFYLVAGPASLRPHSERYGQCLIAGGVLLAARGLEWFLSQPRWRGPATASLLSLAGLSLAGFVALYWIPLAQGGAHAHPTFRTGPVEPKLAALALALRELGPGPMKIGAGSWWVYWPLTYLAGRHSYVTVVTDAGFGRGVAGLPPDCWIELEGTPTYERRSKEPMSRMLSILDPAGRVVLSLFFPPRDNGTLRYDHQSPLRGE